MEPPLPNCYFDVRIGKNKTGRLVFQLMDTLCPVTCKNFRSLCSAKGKPSYSNTVIHRIQPGGFIQGGDVVTGQGDGGQSANVEPFEDENYIVKHDQPYILGMANSERHSNTSQFYITLKALPVLDTKRVAFGRVVEGLEFLKELAEV